MHASSGPCALAGTTRSRTQRSLILSRWANKLDAVGDHVEVQPIDGRPRELHVKSPDLCAAADVTLDPRAGHGRNAGSRRIRQELGPMQAHLKQQLWVLSPSSRCPSAILPTLP